MRIYIATNKLTAAKINTCFGQPNMHNYCAAAKGGPGYHNNTAK